MITRETDRRFFSAPSTVRGAGDGLFAKKRLAAGARLKAVGVLIKPGSPADLCTSWADRYKFRVGKKLLIPTGYAGLVNHSALPNMEKVVKGGRLYLRALRRIEKGEELFFTYSAFAQKGFKSARAAR